jgi:hypothetical protein
MTTPQPHTFLFYAKHPPPELTLTGTMTSHETPGGGLSLDVRGPVELLIDTDPDDEGSAVHRDAPG